MKKVLILIIILIAGYFTLNKFYQAKDEFVGWQTYRNEEYGFEVRYPDNYELKTFERGIWISLPGAGSFEKVYSVNFLDAEGTGLSGITPKIYVDALVATDSIVSQKPIVINKAQGMDVELKSPKSRSVYFQNKPNVMITFQYFLENDTSHLEIGDQIISTFKFIK